MELTQYECEQLANLVRLEYLPGFKKTIEESPDDNIKPMLIQRYNEVVRMVKKAMPDLILDEI